MGVKVRPRYKKSNGEGEKGKLIGWYVITNWRKQRNTKFFSPSKERDRRRSSLLN